VAYAVYSHVLESLVSWTPDEDVCETESMATLAIGSQSRASPAWQVWIFNQTHA
jgi:hypothetical protein